MPRTNPVWLGILVFVSHAHADAEVHEVLRDRSSGRPFAIRVAAPAPPAGGAGGGRAFDRLAAADDFIARHRDLVGAGAPGSELVVDVSEADELGLSRVRYRQRYRGLEVQGGEITIHLDRDGQVRYVKTKLAQVLPQDVHPSIDEAAARRVAVQVVAAEGEKSVHVLRATLLVLPLGIVRNEVEEDTRLAWKLEVVDAGSGGERFAQDYYIDAQTGELILQLSRHWDLYRQVLPYGSEGGGNRVQLNGHDADRSCIDLLPMGCDFETDVPSALFPPYVFGRSEGKPARGPYPDPNPTPYFPYFGTSDVDSVYDFIGAVHQYYADTFGIDGANNLGGAAISPVAAGITRGVVHNESWSVSACPNAVFNATTGTISFCMNMVQPDVLGHEYSHAIQFHSCNPTYRGETGALMEGTSDLMGEVFEQYRRGSHDWESCSPPCALAPLRNLANPGSFFDELRGSPYPDRFHSPYLYCGLSDNWGVHHNSTVFSHGLYLFAHGGQHAANGCSIVGQGLDVTSRILFRGWRTYFHSGETFNEAFADMQEACSDLYPAETCAELTKALQAVQMDQPGTCTGQTGSFPACGNVSAVGDALIGRLALQAFPTPTRSSVEIRFRLEGAGPVTVEIFDVAGRHVRTVMQGISQPGGHTPSWDGRDESGNAVAPGIYVLRLRAGKAVTSQKLVIAR